LFCEEESTLPDYAKPDFWTLKALKEGYPARSVYKLRELAEKYPLFPRGASISLRVLDMGAAPGSWSLYLLRTFRGKINLTSCDLVSLTAEYGKDIFSGDNFTFIQGDFTGNKTRNAIFEKAPFDVIVSDAAPATTGNRLVDTAHSEELAFTVLCYAETALRDGGNLVVKLFQGGTTANFLREAASFFAKCHVFKPKVCRPASFETYFIGIGKLR
jgi:23S rRNA (uridine2552-2'-O)-methyltransferase